MRHNSDNYKTDVTDLCQRHLSKQQVTFQRFLYASSALILAMNFDNFITLFYLMVTNALVHLFTLWYPTALYTKLHNGSDPPLYTKLPCGSRRVNKHTTIRYSLVHRIFDLILFNITVWCSAFFPVLLIGQHVNA